MSQIAVVTDSVSDLEPDEAKERGITVVPLLVTFGDREYRAGVDLSSADFWRELTKAGASFPKTAAPPPGVFGDVFKRLFDDGAQDIVYVGVSTKLSGTIHSATVARETLPVERRTHVHIVDSTSASMGVTLLTQMAVDLAAHGEPAAAIVSEVQRRAGDVKLYVALETMEYLKRGGRISPAKAAIGNVLSVKPIITMVDGAVETADKPRTRSRARARLIELLSAAPLEQVWLLHGQADGMEDFAADLAEASGFPRDQMSVHLIGPSVGPHVGPGSYGAITLRQATRLPD